VREGLASVTPQKGACQYCDLKSLCRVQSLALLADDAAEALPCDDKGAGTFGERGQS
jgi:hypothetical protein